MGRVSHWTFRAIGDENYAGAYALRCDSKISFDYRSQS